MILLWGVPTIRNSPARHEIDPAIEAQIRQRFRLLAASDGLSVVALYGRVAVLK